MATIKKNIYWSLLVSIVQVYTGSVVFVVLAKFMSLYDYGILSFGSSLSLITVVLSDFGFSLMIMKDYPKLKNAQEYIFNSLFIKGIISTLVFIVLVVYLFYVYSDESLIVGIIYLFFAITASFTNYLQALLKIKNKFNKYSETSLIYAIAVTFVIIAYFVFKLTLIFVVIGFLTGKVAQLIWCLWLCRDDVFNGWLPNKRILNDLFRKMWSFGGHYIMGILYFMIDTQMISYFLRTEDVALYQAIFRILLILLMVSEMVSNVLLPYLSYKFHQSLDITEITSRLFLFLLVLACSMFLLFNTFKEALILTLYSKQYLSALPIVFPLGIVLVFRTAASIFGNILTISDNQVYRVITVGISLLVSVTLNFIFIPLYGIIASAWISVVVHFLLFSLYVFFSKKELPNLIILNSEVFIAIGTTIGVYLIVDQVINNHIYASILGVCLWILYLTFFLIKNKNGYYLKSILNDRGI